MGENLWANANLQKWDGILVKQRLKRGIRSVSRLVRSRDGGSTKSMLRETETALSSSVTCS